MRRLLKIWALGLLATLPLLALPCRAVDGAGPLVGVGWLKQNLARPGLVIVDASPASQHRERHIPGAVASTLFTFGPGELPARHVEDQLRSWGVGPGHRIVLYDQGGTYLAARLFWDLVQHGLPAERLSILDGGLAKWVADGGEVTAQATPRPPAGSVSLGAPNPEVRVRLPEFLAATGDPRHNVLLEALQPGYFYGGAAFFNRGGHVPHATLMPSEDFYNDDKTFKSPQEIQRMLDHLGIRREQQVLTYCGGGGAAAVPFFALKFMLGYPRVRLFQESQRGWLQDERELPVWTYGEPHLVRDTPWLKGWASPMLKAFGLSQVSVVDVRGADAFRLGHVPLAVNLPAQSLGSRRDSPAALAALLGQAGVDRAHEAVVISEGGINEDSALAFLLLQSVGQHKVSIYLDSTERWAELGHAVVRPAAAAPAASAAPALPYEATAAGALFVSDAAPSRSLFPRVYLASGARLPARVPDGRVLHLPYTRLLSDDGRPRAANEIWNILDRAGVPRYAEIVVFADQLGEAAVNYVVLRLMGLADVKVWAP